MNPKFDISGLRGFWILLYKGFLLRKRHYLYTAFEIVFPVIIAAIPAIIASEIGFSSSQEKSYMENKTIFSPIDPFVNTRSYRSGKLVFAYAPLNPNTEMLINNSVALWRQYHPSVEVDIKGLQNAEEVEFYCLNRVRQEDTGTVIGTIFNNLFQSSEGKLPSGLDYTIRYGGDFSSYINTQKYRFYFSTYSSNDYISSDFLSWQATVEKIFIQRKTLELGKTPLDYNISMQQFPYPERKVFEGFNLSSQIPSFMIFCFIIFIINLMRRVIEEKSNGSKELMKMMGMSNFTYWMSTFLNFFIVGAVVMLILTIVYKSPLKESVILLEKSNFLLIFIIFLLFIASLILFCLAMSTFFNKAVFGIIFLVIIYNVSTSVLQAMVFADQPPSIKLLTISVFAKLCICLFPPGALNAAFQIISVQESSGEGATWSNINNFDVIPDFNLSQIMLTMLFSCFLYGVIIWYVDAVWPWQYGVPKPFYFLFTKSYWCGYKEKESNEILLGPDSDIKSSEFFEDDPTGVSPGVVINNLSKTFRTGFQTKVAVNNLSLNIYNGQITALLGHNGAGKTTTINILTGLYSPSSGSASINGWDIFKHTAKSRQSLGVCPQHNVLFDTLTVEEHLKIYGSLKGVGWTQLNKEVNDILTMLHLLDKKTELTKNLSGGMKRKLSLGIAVIGGSKVLFLDEPTSGMDVEARRGVWDALLDIRHNRTIILTTHYMEEADILGDRIAIMAEGEVQCCGSSLFLKKKFGTGYHLHIVKENNFNMHSVNEILVKYIPEATPKNEYEREVTFSLASKTNSSFGEMFEEIENNKDALGINSCGVTVTTMEDVFLNVTNIADLKVKKNVENQAVINTDENELKDIYVESNLHAKVLNFRYWFNQFYGLLMKRLHYSKRHWGILVTQLVLPFVLLCLCFYFISLTSSGRFSTVPLKMDIEEVYGKTDGFYSDKHKISNTIKEVLQRNGVRAAAVDDPEQYILDYGKKNLGLYIKNFLVGGSVAGDETLNFTAWYNGLPYHSVPMSLLLMDSAILKHVTDSGSITLTSHPFPSIYENSFEDERHTVERSFANVFFPLALSFLTSSFVLVPIHERTSKAKLLQLMTGIPAAMYWFAMFVWDFFINTVISLLLIIPFAIFAGKIFFAPHSEAIGTAILLMITYGWSSIPFSYLFTLIFQKPNTGFSVVNAVCVLGGVVLSSILSAIDTLVQQNNTAKAFVWLFKLLPPFSLSSGFGKLFVITYSNAFCDMQDEVQLKFKCNQTSYRIPASILKCCKDICGDSCKKQIHPINFVNDGCAAEILFLFFCGILYFALLLLFESSIVAKAGRIVSQNFNRLRKRVVTTPFQVGDSYIEDSDVLQEEERVRSDYLQVANSEALVALGLSKQFKNIKAVDRLSFGIHKTECFGLLGVNGAGKTTTFRMLTGDCYPDEGNALIGSISVITHLKQFQSHIGYCPQFDALMDRLSANEMITLFARLRGLSGPRLEKTVNALIKMTDLTQYADKPSMVYSGGNKRKLSIALALIGAPPLLLLDEPTAGVDPVSRRKIWKILSLARTYTGAAVILTTHSMEESEALCSRLAIMVNGRFRCLGSIQQLKTKFGQGYTLIIKMKKEEQADPQSMNTLKVYIDTNLPGAQLKDDHQGMLQYHIVDPTVTLSYLFKFMDDMKQKCNLEDYVVSDTSLEQIFLAFARSQRVVAT